MQDINSTIAAISTAPGVGAIGIVRMSGPESLDIIEKVFKHSQPIQDRYACFGKIIDNENHDVIDNVLVIFFKAPNSFTGENLVEIHSHGSPFILQRILTILTKLGVSLANPGEFTKRAFLNGKLDLLQAESVADIIHSQTEKSLRQSNIQLQGVLSDKLLHLQKELRKQASLLEIELDFSEEDIEFASRDDLLKMIDQTLNESKKLLKSFQFGRIVQEGAKIVIAGKPNVGKSSLLNRLLLKDRAIVSDLPGTTRDTIEELLDIQGYLFRIIDTAGLRQSADQIEGEGIKRTKQNIKDADVILYIHDANDTDIRLFHEIDLLKHQRLIFVVNKIDLVSNYSAPIVSEFPLLTLSAKTGKGFSLLENELLKIVKDAPEQDVVITKVRHKNALQKTVDYLIHARKSILAQLSEEFIAMDLRAALDALGELTGDTTSDDILNDIFSKFCIGK